MLSSESKINSIRERNESNSTESSTMVERTPKNARIPNEHALRTSRERVRQVEKWENKTARSVKRSGEDC